MFQSTLRSDQREMTLALAAQIHCKAICIMSGFFPLTEMACHSVYTSRLDTSFPTPDSSLGPEGRGDDSRDDTNTAGDECAPGESGECKLQNR